jgi:hypothetical protein
MFPCHQWIKASATDQHYAPISLRASLDEQEVIDAQANQVLGCAPGAWHHHGHDHLVLYDLTVSTGLCLSLLNSTRLLA